GRLQKRKGQDMMIRALPALRRAIPDVLYAIVGDGEERPALERLVDQEGLRQSVQFLGEADADMFLRCSLQCDLFALADRPLGAAGLSIASTGRPSRGTPSACSSTTPRLPR